MHFWNKLTIAALMRLSILASLNLLLGRFVGYWWLLHPLFFLILVTLDLGLYALMVYTGTLNKTLIAMMLAGLAGVLIVIAYSKAHTSFFASDFPFHKLAGRIEDLSNETIRMFPKAGFQAPPKQFWWAHGIEVAYVIVDVMGLVVIFASGLLARVLLARSGHRDNPTSLPPLDSGAASPL
jgi:hypothetical protein